MRICSAILLTGLASALLYSDQMRDTQVRQLIFSVALFGTPVLQMLIHGWQRAAVQGSVRERKSRNMNRLMGPLALAIYIGYERSIPVGTTRMDIVIILPLLLVILALWLDHLIKYQNDFPDRGGG